MRAIWFKKSFVAPILSGEKSDTYRGGGFRKPHVGQMVGLSVGPRLPFATALVTAVEDVDPASIEPSRRAAVAGMCGDTTERLVRVAFRVVETFVAVPAVIHA